MLPEPFAPLTLARILRPWGRHGEVAAEILTDFPERLTGMREVWLAGERGAPRAAKIISCRIHLGQAIFHFDGVQTISDAEVLRGLEVQIPLDERVRLGEGRYFIRTWSAAGFGNMARLLRSVPCKRCSELAKRNGAGCRNPGTSSWPDPPANCSFR